MTPETTGLAPDLDDGVLDPEDRLLEAADDALFGMHGATEGSTQWRIESLQLVNWGGFDGHHPVPLEADATLLTGASGVGKSSLLDAWTALVMPSDARLNGASNDMTTGRARSEGQRNPLSYLRGVVDQTEDRSTSRARQVTLRGDGVDTWGALAATFADDRGRRFTALRVYYVPRRATRTTELVMRLATHEGPVDLRVLEPAVTSRFQPRELRQLVPGLTTHETYAAFAARLFARLGIGANDDGDKALRLLARIQASQPVRSVDELYKEMVLERPATYAAADRAVEHFDELEGSYDTMLTEQQKADLLAPLPDAHARLVAAQDRIDQLDAYGATVDGPSPLGLWELRRRAAVLETATATNRAEREANTTTRAALRRAVDDLATDLAGARTAHREAGGETLDLLAAELQRERTRADALADRRDRLAAQVAPLGIDLGDATAVEAARAEGAAYLAADAQRAETFQRELVAIADERAPLLARRRECELDRASLAGRQGRVPRALDEVRRLLAEVAGLRPEELPFLAELVDVPPAESRWRTAVETVLGSAARQLLVPADRLREFSAAIDRVQVPRRITFIGADLDVAPPGTGDPERVAGKLDYAASPFEGWVRWYVADPARNALCVETPADLDGPGLRVTLAGQTRSGNRGSHGRSGGDIIGFSNADAIAALEAEVDRLDARLRDLGEQQDDLARRRDAAATLRDAHRALAAVPFEDVDVASALARCTDLEEQRSRLLASDDRLRALADEVAAIEERHVAAQVDLQAARAEQERLATVQARLVDAEDEVADRIEALEEAGEVVLTPAQVERLEAEYADAVGPGDPDDLEQLDVNLSRLRGRLAESSREAREQVAQAAAELQRVFVQFKERWPDPNLGTSLASYDDYAAILEEIRRTGLAARREEWQRRLADWSGQDLVPLAQAMVAAVEDIEDRLDPINDILRRLPFGDSSDRLRIKMRRVPPAEVTLFVRELRELSGGAIEELTTEQVEDRFARLQAFMAPLRRRDDPRAQADAYRRDLLLDVRRHVEVSAEKYDPRDGRHLAWYRTLGEKSGGESQELIAFVIGAALRFRLGDELRSRPRFAPVFLDEGFVKADAEFAGRAVQAWRGLGFQLVVGAPFDKFTGLEPHMDEFLEVVKNPETQRARLRRIRSA